MLSQKGHGYDLAAGDRELLEVLRFHHIELQVLQHQLERGIEQPAAIVLGYEDLVRLVAQLQQGLDVDVILMAVCQTDVVDARRQLAEADELLTIALTPARNHRIDHDGEPWALEQEPCMPEIADSNTVLHAYMAILGHL